MILAFTVKIDIPNLLMEKIKSIKFNSKKSKAHAIKLAAVVLYSIDEDTDCQEFYKEMSASYIRDNITSHFFYKTYFLELLQENIKKGINDGKIFQTDGSYTVGFSPLNYRINPDYLVGESMEYEIEIKIECLNDIFPEVINHFNYSVQFLKPIMNRVEMAAKIKQGFQVCLAPNCHFSNVYWSNSKKDPTNGKGVLRLPRKIKLIGDKGYTSTIDIEERINLLNAGQDNTNYSLIIEINKKNKRNYSIAHIKDFYASKEKKFIAAVNKKIDNISIGNWNPIISDTNGRLNHAFTSLNKFCIEFYSLAGEEIKSYDLKSSQPTILANLLIKNPKFLNSIIGSKFKKLNSFIVRNKDVFFILNERDWFSEFLNTDIYSSIGHELGNTNRAMSKKGMMMLLFTEPETYSPFIKPLRTLFPEYLEGLLAVKHSFKENHMSSKKSLPVFLQMVEAHVFLEIIYPALAEAGIPALTKHDSILFPKSRYLEVEKIVADCFEKIGFRGKMELEEPESNINNWPDWYKPAQNEVELFNE